MTINEAYNKGLDDAEAIVIEKFEALLRNNDQGGQPFNNPRLEAIRQIIQERQVDFFALSVKLSPQGKKLRRMIDRNNQTLDSFKN